MSLPEALVESSNIEQAWKNVKENQGAPGPDGITITEFPAWFRPPLEYDFDNSFSMALYQPQPVRRVTIDNPMAVNDC